MGKYTIALLLVTFLIIWMLLMVLCKTVENLICNSKRVKEEKLNTEFDIEQKDRQIVFWRTQAETRNI